VSAARKRPALALAPVSPTTTGGAPFFEQSPHAMDPIGVAYVAGARESLDRLTLMIDDLVRFASGMCISEEQMLDVARVVRSARGNLKAALEVYTKPSNG
jgi:hypothetical protein